MRAVKYLVITLMIVSMGDAVCAISQQPLKDPSENSMTMVGSIHRRYYLIKRLEKPMQLFYSMQEKHKEQQHAVRTAVIRDMTATSLKHYFFNAKNSASFDGLWSDFLSYKYIDDDRFDKEMIVAVLLFYKNMLLLWLDRADDALELSACIDAYSATGYERLSYIPNTVLDDMCADTARMMSTPDRNHILHNILLGHSAWSDFYTDAPYTLQTTLGTLVHVLDAPSTQEPTRLVVSNTLRLYHIQRMLKALFILSYHAKMPISFSSAISSKIETPIVRDCVERMEKTQSLLPLFQVWQRIICYDFIDNIYEVKEFMHVVIIVYKNLACCLHQARMPQGAAASTSSGAQLQNVLELYDQIAALEISELLDLLDDVAMQLDHITHLYELNNADLSWTTWFKKYWWALPVFAAWMYLTILKHVHTQHKTV